ncbi:MAG: PKD domain-containing protein [Ferruginibacter sp.]
MKKIYPILLLLLTASVCSKAQVPILNSLPAAQHIIYLDFDGYTVSGTSWNTSFNSGLAINCAASGYSAAQINTVFNLMAEDYRPFNINVTTDSTLFIAAPIRQKMRVLFTPTSSWYPSPAGGVAYLNTFGGISNKVCFVFVNAIGNASNAAEAGSHEAGHTLTLNHHSTYDGSCNKTNEYNYGTGSGEISWAPIMGVGYGKNMTTWSEIAYNVGCNHAQNDLLQIVSIANQGVAYRADEHGNDNLTASVLDVSTGSFSDSGIITQTGDTDVFKMTIADTSFVSVNAVPWSYGPLNEKANIDISLVIKNAAGDIIRLHEPPATLNAFITNLLLYPGDYFIYIDGMRNANQSGYGSIGKYFINGTVTEAAAQPLDAAFVAGDTMICRGASTYFSDQSSGNPVSWSWTFAGGTPASSSLKDPGLVTYTSAGSYTVTLTVSDGVTNSTKTTSSYIRVNNPPVINVTPAAPSVCGTSSVELVASGALSYTWSPAAGLTTTVLARTRASVSATSTYTVTGTDVNGCINTRNVTIQHYPSPVLTKTPADESLTVCRNDSTTLTVTGALTYSWSPITGLSNTTGPTVKARVTSGSMNYFVTGTDVNGCTATTGFRLTSRPCDSLVAEYTVDSAAVCAPACVSFADYSTGNPTEWLWDFPGGIPSSSTLQNPGLVCYNSPGTYDASLRVISGTDTSYRTFSSVLVAGAKPAVTMMANQTTICLNDSAGIKVGGAQYYNWVFQPSLYFIGYSDSVKVKPTDTTWYTVTGNVNVFNNAAQGGTAGAFKICTAKDSIRINVINCTTVPLKLLHFTANYNRRIVYSSWQVEAQDGIANYWVQRSENGLDFYDLTSVPVKNETQYQWADKTLPATARKLYYRLRWKDMQGREYVSAVAQVTIDEMQSWVTISPNPVKNILQIKINAADIAAANVSIFDAMGKQLQVQKFALQTGINIKSLNASSLPAGLYILKLQVGTGMQVLKFVKGE